jgi:glyoxylase-like metal-dependent hydrolase (beta-lactamase superfamily II)
MKIHHLNCGTQRARVLGVRSIAYCLLLEEADGLNLVDTGFGLADYRSPSWRMRMFLWLLRVPRREEQTARRQIEALGLDPGRLQHIVMTHLHLDHAGGLRDFPWAQVHVHRLELDSALRRQGPLGFGYDPPQWSHDPHWVLHDGAGRDWFGFRALPVLESKADELLLVPLPGHTPGHCGVAVWTRAGWLLQCGDAAAPRHRATQWREDQVEAPTSRIIPSRVVRWSNGRQAERLRLLVRKHGSEVEVISGHDIAGFERLRGW